MNYDHKFKLIPSVYLLLIKDGKILLARRKDTGYEDGNYGLVAGHVDGQETFRAAMQREAKEEGGLHIELRHLQHALTMHRWCGDHERVDIFFTCSTWEGEPKIMEPHLCDAMAWFPLQALPQNIIPYIQTAIALQQEGVTYTEFGWEEKYTTTNL